MSEDMQWFVKGLYILLRDVLVSLQSDGDTTSAIMEQYVAVALAIIMEQFTLLVLLSSCCVFC